MRKLLVWAFVAVLAVRCSADTYLYWMLSETPSSAGSEESYFAAVKVVGEDAYLNFGNDVSGLVAAEAVAFQRYQMEISNYAADTAFVIELWTEGAREAAFRSRTAYAYGDLLSAGCISDGSERFNALVVGGADFAAVPEPTCGQAVLLGAALLGLKRRRRG